MADIFLSYTHVDRERARPLVELLENEGWTVWWDRGIQPGMTWQPELEKELTLARVVIVLWSKTSVKSEWVVREASIGSEKNVLVPVMIDAQALPKSFERIQATDLSAWKAPERPHEIEALLRRINGLAPPSRTDTVRPGYDPAFLGEERVVPLPGVTGPAAVLRYLHFTVVMNPGRRLAHYSAYNMEGGHFVELPRDDDWAGDPILPESLQVDHAVFRKSEYDRGHLMARSNVCWGEERQAWIASRQAFFWTNIAPQHAQLNRHWWLALENWERDIAVKERRAIGFSGPILGRDDEPFRGEIELDGGVVARDTFHVPRAYWKLVVVARPRKRLAAAGFFMDQYAMLAAKAPRTVKPSDYRITLRELESKSGVQFAPTLHEAAELSSDA